jgi:2-methylcitrate dehydratase PrpD
MIAEFVATTTFEDMPDEVVEVTKRCFLDGLASIYAGSSEPCAQIARKYLSQVGGSQEANTLGEGTLKVPIHMAAFANGVAGHALDFDDTALSLEKDRSVLIHPTMPPLSACLAVGEYVEANGRELLTAFVLGFEIEVKIAEAINPEHFTGGRGFHSSGTIGVFGSVVAASRLLKLTEEQTRNAIAIAATMSAGLGVNHGTMSKPVNMGRSSETGVTAARLASLGFDGPANSLEGGRGFFEAFGGGYDPTKISGRLGSPWACLNPGTSVKPYPSGVVGHPGMDTMRRMVEKHDIKPEEVASVTVRTGENVIFPGPLRIELATSALEAKFCVPFQMSAIILNRKAGLEEFSDAFVQSTLCQEMQKRVTAVLEPEIVALGKDKVIYEIDLVTTDGRSFTERSDDLYRGGPRNPLTWDELVAKFSDCSRALFGEEQRDAIVVSVRNLDQATGVFPLRNL